MSEIPVRELHEESNDMSSNLVLITAVPHVCDQTIEVIIWYACVRYITVYITSIDKNHEKLRQAHIHALHLYQVKISLHDQRLE